VCELVVELTKHGPVPYQEEEEADKELMSLSSDLTTPEDSLLQLN
jgi:hypothetical protein